MMVATYPSASHRAELRPALLEIEDLSIGYRSGEGGVVPVIRNATLSIAPGERVGIVGESGSGKSTLALAMLGFLKRGGLRTSGEVRFAGASLFSMTPDALREIRGRRISFVPQNAGQALTPTLRIGTQIEEALRRNQGEKAQEAQSEARRLLESVRLQKAELLARRYPHELSGGQLQRVVIALALAGKPELFVLDEPTTGLDITTQISVLDLLDEIASSTGAAMIFVSHDLAVMARSANRLVTMYAGEIVEDGQLANAFEAPHHPYTKGLLASAPRIDRHTLPHPLIGSAPSPGLFVTGCAFAPRCSYCTEICRTIHPNLVVTHRDQGRRSRCHHWTEMTLADVPWSGADKRHPRDPNAQAALLTVQDLAVDYRHTGMTERLKQVVWKPVARAPVVEKVSLSIGIGETLAIVGESGSGKSTIARAIAGALSPLEGSITFASHRLAETVATRTIEDRRGIQFIFQNPDSALNPRHTIYQILDRPLQHFTDMNKRERRTRIETLVTEVRLPSNYLDRFPGQLSGGEKQRVAIARALAPDPALILCDEIVSALDVSVQAAIVRLLVNLQQTRQTSYLFVAHDLAVVRAIADRVAVLYSGRLCEIGSADEVYSAPFHPYTAMLIAAATLQTPNSTSRAVRRPLIGEIAITSRGCPFASRCEYRIAGLCEREEPPWRSFGTTHTIRCHLSPDELTTGVGSLLVQGLHSERPDTPWQKNGTGDG